MPAAPAVFCRFAGCNLWSGREADRARQRLARSATPISSASMAPKAAATPPPTHWPMPSWPSWGEEPAFRCVVLTGGEPLLQADAPLIEALHRRRFWIAVETNGTIAAPAGLDWICVSPKRRLPLWCSARGHELKLAYPQPGTDPLHYAALEFASFRLQPIDGPDIGANTSAAIDYCLAHRQWQLSVQTHKLVGLR